MKRIVKLITILGLGVLLVALLAGCAGTQAKAGELYIAEEDAKITTVVGMRSIRTCDAPEGTVAFTTRETFFGIMEGSAGQTNILLTQIFHTTSRCAAIGEDDFIREDPADAGWTKLEAGSAKWLIALKTICQTDHQPADLKELCEANSD